MRVPKNILKIIDVAARDTARRYALTSVLLKRKGESVTAVATDGRRLLAATFKDEPGEAIPGLEDAQKPVADYKVMIPASALRRARGSAVKNKPGEAPSVIIDEPGTNGKVRMISVDRFNDTTTSVEVGVDERNFPPFEDVVPTHDLVEDASSRGKGTATIRKAVQISVSPTLLAELLEAMAAAAPSDQSAVTLEIPMTPDRPIKLWRKTTDVEIVGVLMPVMLPPEQRKKASKR